MKISVITTTARPEARLVEMSRALAASHELAGVSLEWIIVDAIGHQDAIAIPCVLLDGHDLARDDEAGELVDSSRARNLALMRATGDYVCFLPDCTVVTEQWLKTVAAAAAMGKGFNSRGVIVADLKFDWGRPFNHAVIPDKRWRPAPPSTVTGAWGAPMESLRAIGGFDEAYDGDPHGHDIECAIRLERVGVRFVTTTRAVAVRLRRTLSQKEVLRGTRNKNYLVELTKERDRTLPRAGSPSLAPPAQAAIPASSPPREAPVAGAGASHSTGGAGPAPSVSRRPARVAPRVATAAPKARPSAPVRRQPPAAPPGANGDRARREESGGAPASVHGAPDAGAHGRQPSTADVIELDDALRDFTDVDGDAIDAFVKATGDNADLTETVDLDPAAPLPPPPSIPDLPLGASSGNGTSKPPL